MKQYKVVVGVIVCHYRDLEFECRYKGGVLSTHATRTSRSTGKSASHYRHLEFEGVMMKGGP